MTEHFIIPGAQRAATTLLTRLLDQHPEIAMAKPIRPEPKYFLDAAAVDRGRAGYRARFAEVAAGVRILGEKSTSYLEIPAVPARIATVLPGAKVLIVLRDPIERAISNYRFSRANGFEVASIDEAFRLEPQRVSRLDWQGASVCPFAYLKRGRYAEQLSHWDRAFPAVQRLIVLYEQLIQSPAVLTTIFRFLGVDPRFQPVFPREPIAPSAGAAVVDVPLRRYLADYFAEPNRKLGERYELDLSCWSRVRPCTRPLRPHAGMSSSRPLP